MEQATLLREGRLASEAVANIAEEIESMGRAEKLELVNRLTILLLHLLKWQFPARLSQRELEFEHSRTAHPPTRPSR
jgi:hypothetical protein